MWFQESFFKYTVAIIFILLIIALSYYTAPVFYPILWFIAAILLPILFSTLLYYILRPIVNLLNRWMPRNLAILAVYLLIGFVALIVILLIGPKIAEEFNSIVKVLSETNLETLKSNTSDLLAKLKQYTNIPSFPELGDIVLKYIQKFNAFVAEFLLNSITSLASIAIALALTPFILFYFLKDDILFSKFVMRYVPLEFQDETQKILVDIDSTLSNFIFAQMTVAAVIGFFLFIGYVLIGLPQAIFLALFAMIFYVIPILGTFIAVIPAIIVAFSVSFTMVLKVVAVMFVAHFLETNLLTPRLMQHKLKIHPLTVILLLLAAGKLYGLVGLLLVTPTYAILKVIVWNLYKISLLRYALAKAKTPEEGSSQ